MHFFIWFLFISLLLIDLRSTGQSIKYSKFFTDCFTLQADRTESLFPRNNFLLLAQQYNIDATKALVIQAKLLPNPNITFSRGAFIPIYDAQSNYPHSTNFSKIENSAQLSQFKLLAGKRNKQIKIVQSNVKLAEYQFCDLIRSVTISVLLETLTFIPVLIFSIKTV